MNKQEFAQKIKAKYPAYSTMDDAELADKMLAKYPSYGSQISDTITPQPQQPSQWQPPSAEEEALQSPDFLPGLVAPENLAPAGMAMKAGAAGLRGLAAKGLEKSLNYIPRMVGNVAVESAALPKAAATDVTLSAKDKLIEALGRAKVSRKQLAQMQHSRKKEQSAMLASIYSKSTGQETSKIARGSMKGPLVDKMPDFDPLRPKLEQTDIDDLVKQIHLNDKLRPFDILKTDEALRKVIDGEIPQPAEIGMLKQVFGEEVTKKVLKLRPWQSKVLDVVTTGANLPRAIMASFDASAPLRQGLVLTASHPRLAGKAFTESWKQTFNPARYAEWLDSIKGHPLYELMEDSKLYIADPERQAATMFGKEERFMTETSVQGKELWKRLVNMGLAPIRASERNYTSYLNKLRVDSFAQLADTFIKQGKTPEADPELFQHLAKFINSATGRGSMEGWQRSAQLLNTVFFSPRLVKARLDMAKYVAPGNNIPWEVRKEALKDIGLTISAGMTFLGLMGLAGAEIEKDPRSSDWMKAKIGNVRIDPWGGFQQYGKLYARAFNWDGMKQGDFNKVFSGKMKTGSGEVKPTTAFDELTKFFRYKMAPVPSYGVELLSGKKVMGGEVDYLPEEKIIPMIFQDIQEVAKENPNLMFMTGPLAFFGMNVQQYQPKKKFY